MPAPAGKTGGASTGFTLNRRIGAARAKEITTVEDFTLGYRSREDASLLKPQTLVPGSHDVLSSVTGTISARKGYTVDGVESSVVSPIRAPYDWTTSTGYIHHLRAGFISSAGNDGKLQLRWVDSTGSLGAKNGVYWLDLLTALTGTYFHYAPLWDSSQSQATNIQEKLLMVNRGNALWEWNGAIDTVGAVGNPSTGVYSITTGSGKTWVQAGFYYDSSDGIMGDATTHWTVGLSGSTVTYTYSSGTTPVIAPIIGTNVTIPSGANAGTYPITATTSSSFSFVLAGANTSTVNFAIPYDGGYGYKIINNAVVYTYGANANTSTLLLTTSTLGMVIGSPVYQQPIQSSPFQSFTFGGGGSTPTPPNGFTLDVIAVRRTSNQVLISSITNNIVYLSQAGNYTVYSQSSARVQFEGDMATTVGPVVGFSPQDGEVYITAGVDEFYTTTFVQTTITDSTTGTTTVFETFQLSQLKTSALQAAISQYAMTKIADSIVYISNEPIVNSLGPVKDILNIPIITDLSYAIVNDVNSYNLTDAWCAYNKQFLYVGFPAMGLFRMYNMTNPKNPYWEAPININLSGVSFVGTTVLGHSYNTSESYILFNGYSDRAASINQTGLPISAQALFAFQTDGLRPRRKSFNKFWVEGYIGSATTLNVGLIFRSPNPGTSFGQTVTIKGTDSIVLIPTDTSSLGKSALGTNPLGGDIQYPQQLNLPPYFAVNKQITRYPYLNYQPGFYSYGVNQVWSILSYGNNGAPTAEIETDLTV
jgi:hypothetical protein